MGVLLERSEVDKSLRALETVIAVFYDYCQLSASIAATSRKLARALKDTAVIKATSQYPANTLSAAALIFDAAGEVDLKYSKTVEREYEASMNELKKWVKKLKKEDKSLDEYTMAANAKIKAAGIAYEKKAKRRDKDAAEEHTRYTTLLSTLGSEMSSAKHQHALFVTSKHTTTLYSLSASLGRVAEAQWLRVCETVRRSSPSIGPLGEGKAYIEGNFLSQAPPDLPSDTNSDTINSLPPSNSSSAPLPPPSPSLPTSNITPTTNLTFITSTPDLVRERGRERESVRGTTIKIPSTEALEKITEDLRHSLALPAGLAIVVKDKVNASQTSLVPIPETTPVSASSPSQSVQSLLPTLTTEESSSDALAPKPTTNQTQEAAPSTATTPQLQAKAIEPPEQKPLTHTQGIPAPAAAVEPSDPSSPVKSLRSRKSNVPPPLRTTTPPIAPKTHAEALERIAESFQSPALSEPTSLPRVERPPSRPFQRVASPPTRGLPERVASPPKPQRADSLPLSQAMERINTPPVHMPAPGGVFRERGERERERERPHSIAVANEIPYRDVQRPIPLSLPTQEQPLQSHEYDRAARTRSIDSTFTNGAGSGAVSGGGNHVANLRDRWNDRQYEMSPPSQQPFRGETMRPPSRVAEMASRFNTNINPDTTPPPSSYPYPRGAMPPNMSRWSASSDNLPLRTPLHNRQSAMMDDYSPPPPHRREREREREVDWRAEELELEQKRLDLEIQRHRLEAARRREVGLVRDRDRDSPYGGTAEESPVMMRDRDGRGTTRPPLMPPSSAPRAYSRSPVFDSPPELQPHTNPRHSVHFDDRDRDMDYGTALPAQPRSSWYMDDPPHPHTPPQDVAPPKERHNWLGRGLRKLSIPTLSDSRDGGRDRQALPDNRSRRSFEDRRDVYVGERR